MSVYAPVIQAIISDSFSDYWVFAG